VKVTLREENFGLARNLTSGISEVLGQHDSIIVVEDDIVVSPFFLRFMNEALGHYGGEPRVGSISGYCYPLAGEVPETFFLRGADCWGWATWRDRWRVYNPNGRELLSELRRRKLTRQFDFDGTTILTKILKDQISGKVNSWAIRWHATCFLRDLLILYPGRSLVQNIGHDGTGTHSKASGTVYDVELSPSPIAVGGIAIEENAAARAAVRDFFRRAYKRSNIFRRIAVAVIDFLGLGETLRQLRSRGLLPRRVS
jgi:glycosyltransferase involved in cell wall biosynthesis